MAIFRLIALILIIVALMLTGVDLYAILESGSGASVDQLETIKEAWGTVHPGSLEAAGSKVPEFILGLPASPTLGGVGVILAVLFRNRG
jgi:hypothetical protein